MRPMSKKMRMYNAIMGALAAIEHCMTSKREDGILSILDEFR